MNKHLATLLLVALFVLAAAGSVWACGSSDPSNCRSGDCKEKIQDQDG